MLQVHRAEGVISEDCENTIVKHCKFNYENDPLACGDFLDLFVDCKCHFLSLEAEKVFKCCLTTDSDCSILFGCAVPHHCNYRSSFSSPAKVLDRSMVEGRNGKGIIYVWVSRVAESISLFLL